MAATSSAIDTIVANTLTEDNDETMSVKVIQGIIKRLMKYWILGALLGLTHFILGIIAVADPCKFGSHAIGLSEYGTCFWLAGTITVLGIVGICTGVRMKFTETMIKIHGFIAAVALLMTIVGYVLLGINLTRLFDLKSYQTIVIDSSCSVAVSLIKTSSVLVTLGLFIVVTIYVIICGYTLQAYYYTSKEIIKTSRSGMPVQV